MSAVLSAVDDYGHDRQVAQLRVPPHSIEAESSVLGGLLLGDVGWCGQGGAEESVDDIVDVGEIPGLSAVAKDHRGFAAEHPGAEAGDHARVGRIKSLAGTEDVKKTGTDERDAVVVRGEPAVLFGGVFLQRVRRQRLGWKRLVLQAGGLIAIDTGGTGKDQTLHRVRPANVEQGDGGRQIGGMTGQRRFNGTGDAGQGGEVENVVATSEALTQQGGISCIAGNAFDRAARPSCRQVFLAAEREIIEHPDAASTTEPGSGQM